MHDPFAWSFPLGRLFGITVRIHWLFPFVALGWILHAAFYPSQAVVGAGGTVDFKVPESAWIDACILMLILFVSVLLHEFGHCFAARAVNGDAQEVLLWPLGGLANVDVPHRPRAHFLTALGGPAVNILLVILCTLLLLVIDSRGFRPNWNPFPGGWPARAGDQVVLYTWSGGKDALSVYLLPVWLARICWVNYFLALLNIVLMGFPLDGGRMLQACLWPSMGYRQSMLFVVFAGFVVVFIVGLYAIIQSSVLALCLALFIFAASQRQWVILETGGEDGVFGYDFSQGYTSLERDQIQAAPPARKVSWWRRWLQRRAARKMQKEMEKREAEERRLDELLDKLHRQGRAALTDEEQRFMKRVSDRYRNRN
jgi:stage IV sporulation protein FB